MFITNKFKDISNHSTSQQMNRMVCEQNEEITHTTKRETDRQT